MAADRPIPDKPDYVTRLLDRLRAAGARQQAAVARLLARLRQAGAREQAAALADRLPGAGLFNLFREQDSRQDRFRFGREADGSPAEPWGWEDLDLWLIPRLRGQAAPA